ncbi:GlxA family transcriptional regulator [Amantichitinum ursilacus]|uniref:HTH-type transcriptional regulator CdhR n=1 Tax=Amantichitinum ursilacus TaxID=857265 RepID=A0A0N0XNA0_9NEIS|nr:GlxA family transcriptional regulator [Amantichitinum ursilacus]KPC54996.1 HTH-type transcriptional regulator CdhR [Amantichitinum ursilacus]
MRHIAIAIFPGVQLLDVAGPMDVFDEANTFIDADAAYRVRLVAATPAPVRASNGSRLLPDQTFAQGAAGFDTVLVAGGPALPERAPDAALSGFLMDAAQVCARFGSVCTGAFALAHAGLLAGRHVTTHWQNAPRLAAQYPQARVELDRIYIRDGKLFTSAGVTAGIDLTLALVAEDHGADVALAVAKRLVVFTQRRGGQSQFSPYVSARPDLATASGKAQAYVLAHINQRISVEQLADAAGMSARNFARVFVQETGITPNEFVERSRVDLARSLLETTAAPLKVVAYDCGFSSAELMRRVLVRRIGVSPADYRAAFSAPSARPAAA